MHFSRSWVQKRALSQGLTLPEVIVVIAILVVLAAMLLPVLATANKRSARVSCVLNLKEDALAMNIWEGDHNDHYAQQLSITNGGAEELLADGNVAAYFQVMSNELTTPKILTCPIDDQRVPANSWVALNNTNLSYFVNPSASDSYPQMVLS
jgi:prepilin-type N-terminal cleavage/methylation domain-containing protein